MKQGSKGFSLVELMVAVAIVGLLVAIIIPQYQHFAMKTKRAEAIVILKHVYKSEIAYFAANDGFLHFCDGASVLKNCFHITGTSSDGWVHDINKALGIGDISETKYGYTFTYIFKRNFLSEPWKKFSLFLENDRLDSDPSIDELFIHHNATLMIPAGSPNGIPILLKDDVTNR